MNKIFKVVWSKTKNAYVVVSEVAKASGKSSVKSRVGRASLAATLAVSFMLSAGVIDNAAEAAVYTPAATEVSVNKATAGHYITGNGERVLGGWNNMSEATTDELNSSITVTGGKFNMVVGGNYTSTATDMTVKTTNVVIDGATVKQLFGGTGFNSVNDSDNAAGRTTNVTIKSGNLGNAIDNTNCPEMIVTAGDLVKTTTGSSAPTNHTTTATIGDANLTITGGTFDAVVYGGSVSARPYSGYSGGEIKSTVNKSNVKITGGTFNEAIVAGGLAWGHATDSIVNEANLTISGKDGNLTISEGTHIFAGGLIDGHGYNDEGDAAVGTATIKIDNAEVQNIYGTGGTTIAVNQGGTHESGIGGNYDWTYAQRANAVVDTDLTLDTVEANTVDIAKGSITLKGNNTIEAIKAGADTTVDVSGNTDVDTLQVEQKELNFNGDGVLDIAKSVTKDMTYTADDGVTDATVVYNNPNPTVTNTVIDGETITLTGVNLEVNSDYARESYSKGMIANTKIVSDAVVTFNQNGSDLALGASAGGANPDVSSITAKEIIVDSDAGVAVYVGPNADYTLDAETITLISHFKSASQSTAGGINAFSGGSVEVKGFNLLDIDVTSDVDKEGGYGIVANAGSVVDVIGSENSIITVDSVGRSALLALSAGELNIETKDLTAGTTALEGGNEVRKNSTLGAQGIGSAVNITATGAVTLTAEEGMNAIGADTGASVAVDAAGNVNIEGQIEGSGANGNRAEISVAGNDISVDTAGEDAVRGFLSNITINAEDELNITSRDKDAIQSVVSQVELNAKTVNLTAGYDGWGINATGDAGNDITVNAENVNVVGELGGIQNLAKSTIEVNTDNIMIDAGENEALRAVNNGMIEVNAAKSAAVTGDVTASTGGSVTAEFNSATSYLVGNVTTDDASQTNLTFGKGAVWTTRDSGASSVTDLTVDGGTINQNSTDDITIGNYSGQGNVVFKDEKAGDIIVKNAAGGSAVQLSMASVTADDIQSTGDLNDIANKLEATQDTKAALSTSVYVTGGLLNNEINADVIYEDVDGDGLFNAHIAQMTQSSKPTTTVTAVSGIAANAAVAWRDEDATFSQRLGELRESEGDQGVWARFTQGEFERGNDFETEYNMFQIGYDRAKGDWHYGVAVSHNEGDTTYSAGSGEFSSTSFSAYGTWLGSKGHYKDLVAKIGVIDNEYTVSAAGQLTKGDYDTVGTSLSAEYGMKNDMGDGWFVTPLAKMTYMHIGAADYTTNNGISVKHKSVDSLIARLGVELGKQLGKKGDVYVKASALHDFGGDADTVLRLGSNRASITDEIGGTWYEVGLGFNYKTSDATYLYADVIKTYGDEIRTPWQWNIGARYSF